MPAADRCGGRAGPGRAAGADPGAYDAGSAPRPGPSPAAQAGWAAAWPPAGPGADCDASIVPVVTGHLDHQLLGQLAAELLRRQPGQPGSGLPGSGQGGAAGIGGAAGEADRASGRWLRAERAARQLIITRAVGLLSGPGGLASYLRTRLPDDLVASVSLPLDIGAVTDTIPVHLRRAVTVRDRHCRFPGCTQPAPACQPHHIIPRAQGGPTSLTNLINLCSFHHLVAIHRWGWGIALHPDGTVTATSPDGRTLHTHSPPATAA